MLRVQVQSGSCIFRQSLIKGLGTQILLLIDTESGQAGEAEGRGVPVAAAGGRGGSRAGGGPPAAALRPVQAPIRAAARKPEGRSGGRSAGCAPVAARGLPPHRGLLNL